MKETEAIANLAERSSGIDIVGNIPWGSHFCQLYRTKQDLLDIAVPYFKAGLENGEFCVWVTSEFLNNNEAKAAMGKAVPGFPEYFDSGQMEIISRGEWYFKDGKFAMNRVLRSWFEKYGQGLAMGFCGMRVSGDHFWPESEKSRSDFSEYESNISGAIRGKNILALCVYPQDKCAAAEIIDMVKNLEFALIKRAGGWETIEGLGHKKTQEALRESEKRYHKLFDTMAEGSALSEIILGKDGRPIDYRFIDVNPAFEKFTGLTRREIVGKLRRQVPIILNTSSFEAYARVALTGKPEYFENYNKTLGKYYRVNVYSPEPMRFVSVFTDITERKLAENKLNKLNRILKSLSDANQALINIDDEKKYLQKICDIIIGDCGYSMVWIGYANNDEEKSVVPIACAGFENGYLEKLKITWSGTERGQGPTGTSIRTGKPCGCSNMLTDPFFAPWRDEAAARGYASSLALPLVHGDDVFGVITIYSRQPDEFLKDEVELLQKLADDVAKGIFSIRLEAAKKRAEDLLRESEKKFRQITDTIPNLVWIIENDGDVEYVNLTFRNYTGVKDNPRVAIWLAAPLTVEGRHGMEASHKKALNSGQPYQLEQRIRRVDGSWRWYLTRCLPIKNSGGEILKWYCAATDIHEIKQAQENLRHADEEKNKFISTMSHELRNPLTPIVAGIELVKSYLEQEAASEEKKNARDEIIRESVSIIDQQAKNMARLLDDMLDISRISRGKVQLKKEVVCLRDSLVRAVEATAPLIKSQNHNFAVALPAASLFVFADPVRLQQVFVNLLNNAVKYTPPGGNIWLQAERAGNYARIMVRDSGLGIDQETIKSIFSSFGNSRGITPFVSTQGELGIGLKLTKDLVNLHRGTISASSPGKNRGCEFTVKLPAMILAQESDPDDISGAEVPGQLDKFRTLVVDDNRDAADLCAKALNFFGHEAKVCYDAASALEVARLYKPQIMFIDIEMPGMNGYELAKKLRGMEDPSFPLKLAAVTGYGQKEDKERALVSGFNMHLAKPVTMQTLRQAIDELMKNQP